MKRYETYKDSGIQWVGEIPSHWDVVKTSYLFDDIGSGTTPNTNDDSLYDTDNGINWLQTGDLNDGHITKTSKKISQKAIEGNGTLRLYPINSLVIALYGATIGKVGVLDIESTTNQACCVLPPSDKISTDFAYYIFLASKEALLNLASGGGQPNISQAIIKSHRIPYPSYAEQQSIVSFLEDKVGQIDATIAEKEQMLEDLKNYRSAIISEAVTKGLDKNVEMKDSGIEWMGMIPKHWGLVKLKNKAKVNGRIGFRGYTTADLVPKGQGAYTIGGKHITNCVIDLSNPDFISWDKYYESPEIMVKKGDILMAQRGSLGKAALVREDIGHATINPSLVLLNSIAMNEVFLYYYLVSSSCLAYIDLLNTATAVPMISQNQIENIFVPIPSGKEQKQIADYLDRKTKEIDETTIMVSTQISDLKSYKSALITEAVTGKIDLREWKPKEENV